jgi:UDP-glucuronate 4-epimerase
MGDPMDPKTTLGPMISKEHFETVKEYLEIAKSEGELIYAGEAPEGLTGWYIAPHLFKLPTTGLRFFTVYGPWGRPDMALFLFTKAILDGKPIDVFNYGKMQRDFTYIDDIVEGVVRVLWRPASPDPAWNGDSPDPGSSYAPYKVYNIGNNQPVELMHFIKVIEDTLGKKAKKNLLPLQPGDVPATYANIDDLVRDTGFKPSTTLEEGIPKFIKWYREYFGI